MRDIENFEDIKHLVDSFYTEVKKDDTIAYIFDDVMKVNWESHLPRMYSFWETILLGNHTFKGNPILKHININAIEQLTQAHFNRWEEIWLSTINHNFEGSKAENAKQRAHVMKQLMLYKIRASEQENFIQ